MLASQRKKLEEELLVLEDEILNAVGLVLMSTPFETDGGYRKGSLSRKPGSKATWDWDSDFNLTERSHVSVGLHSVAIS